MKLTLTAFLTASAAAHAAISISLPGNSEQASWVALNSTNYPGAGGTSSYFTSGDPWPAPIAGNAGSTSGAVFAKVSGSGYFAGGSVYDAGQAGVFSLSDDAPLADLATIVLQIDAGAAISSAPVLHYNGGSQSLAADLFTTVAGNYVANGFNGPYQTSNFAWQWDLSAIPDITSYEIVWGSAAADHLSMFDLTISAGETFVQAVPEPSSLVMVSLASLALFRRRR